MSPTTIERPRTGAVSPTTIERPRTGAVSPTTIERPRTGAVSPTTVERPRTRGPGSGLGGNWRVIVLNDQHNTFAGVANALARTIPGVSLDKGHAIADVIHRQGQAIVWTGMRETAEHYWEQLRDAGLTMAPLECD